MRHALLLSAVLGQLLIASAVSATAQVESAEENASTASFNHRRGDVIVDENAMLKIIESVNIPARRSGVIESMSVSEGQLVNQGEVIAKIDDAQALLQLRQAELDLAIAEREASDDIHVRFADKSLEVARADLRRAEELRAGPFDLVPDSEYERLLLVVDRTELEREQAELDREIARLRTEVETSKIAQRSLDAQQHHVVSPIDGMVVSLEKRAGEWAKEADTLVRIVRIDRLRVEGMITAEQANGDLIGRSVTLTEIPGKPDLIAQGRIVFVNPEAIASGARLRVWAEVENTELRLFPGLRCTMTIQLSDDN